MFRPLTRIKQKLSEEDCEEILRTALRGVLALNGEDGYPYAIPINHYFDPDTRKVYFHSGKLGYKVDCVTASNKACFTVSDEGRRLDGEWWLTIRSVILFGKISKVTDEETIREISRKLSHKFTQDESYIDSEIARYASATLLLALDIEDMQGKSVREK